MATLYLARTTSAPPPVILSLADGGKEASSTISSKGQITVPLEVRRHLGVKQGDRVEFVIEQDKTVLRSLQPEVNPFDEFIGALPYFKNIDEINAWVRDLRDPNGEYVS